MKKMKRKIVIGAIILLILSGITFMYIYIIPHRYVIPYTLTELYGLNLEVPFPLGKEKSGGKLIWQDCQRDKDKNIVLSITPAQKIRYIQNQRKLMEIWQQITLFYNYHIEYNENYTQVYIKSDTQDIEDIPEDKEIYLYMFRCYAYQVVTGHEDNMVTVIIEDEDGNKYAEKHFTKFPSDVECYEILPEQSLSLEDIEESGEYEAINLNYDGNYEVIATPEQYEKLTQKSEVKEAANKKMKINSVYIVMPEELTVIAAAKNMEATSYRDILDEERLVSDGMKKNITNITNVEAVVCLYCRKIFR